MKTLYFSLLLLFASLSITPPIYSQFSGQAKLDSLLAELPKVKGDTNEVNLLAMLSSVSAEVDPDKGIEYGTKGIELATNLNWEKGISLSFNAIATNYYNKSNYPKALEYYQKALGVNKKIGNKFLEAKNLNNIANIYCDQSNYPKALEYYNKALKINEQLGNKSGIAANLGNIGIIYENQSDYPKALKLYLEVLKISEELGRKSSISRSLYNIGNVYYSLSNLPKSLEYYQKALKISKELGNKLQIAINTGSIAMIYDIQSNYPKAIDYYTKALKISREIGDRIGEAIVLNSLGRMYYDRVKYSEALEHYKKALKINREIGNDRGVALNYQNMGDLYLKLFQDSTIRSISPEYKYLTINKEANLNLSIEYLQNAKNIYLQAGELLWQSQVLNSLYIAYKEKGEYKKSLQTYEEYTKLKDSVFSEENRDKIAALEKAREDDVNRIKIEKQRVQIVAEKKEKSYIIYGATGALLSVLLILGLVFYQRKKSDKLLHNVLPITIADRLKKKEHPISDYFEQASIVFIDIVGFTALAKDADPQGIVSSLNQIFTKYDTIAEKYGLEKIKTIGDSYMAAAGIPVVQEDNTLRAAKFALEVKDMMKDYHTADDTRIEVRIGLDCGPVVAGVIGEKKFIYDMWSDAVNTASRMESSSQAGEVQVSDRFKEAVTHYEEFSYVERGEIEIKGKGKMKTYFMS